MTVALTALVVLAGLVAVVTAVDQQQVAVTFLCPDVDQSKCAVGEVRINPCRVRKSCIFKRGKNVSMEFDFTPNFSTSNLKTGVYWTNPTGVDVAFSGLGSDNACELTACPTVSGAQQLLNYNLYIGRKLPKGTFQFKWKVWNGDDTSEVCCFKTSIVIKAAAAPDVPSESK